MYKKFIEGKKAVAFDLNGTLLDDLQQLVQAFVNVIRSEDLGNPKTLIDFFEQGVSFTDTFGYIIQAAKNEGHPIKKNASDLAKLTELEYARLIKESNVEVLEGFWEFFNYITGTLNLKTCLVTSTSKEATDIVLEKLELTGMFTTVITGEMVKKPKPNPESYVRAAQALNVRTSEILAFEDSVIGAKAASEAACDVAVVWDTDTPKSKYEGNISFWITDFVGLAEKIRYSVEEILKKTPQYFEELMRQGIVADPRKQNLISGTQPKSAQDSAEK